MLILQQILFLSMFISIGFCIIELKKIHTCRKNLSLLHFIQVTHHLSDSPIHLKDKIFCSRVPYLKPEFKLILSGKL